MKKRAFIKKTNFVTIILSIFLFVITVSADIIPPNSTAFKRCVKVVNLEDYPEIVLFGSYSGPMLTGFKTYEIKGSKCLTKGYKFNKLNIYWNTKENIVNIDSEKLLIEKLEPNGGYVKKDNPLVSEEIEYSLSKISDDKFVLYKSKLISKFNDGSLEKVETFDEAGMAIELDDEEDGFWSSFFNFFGF